MKNHNLDFNDKNVFKDHKFREISTNIKNDKYFKIEDVGNFFDYPQLTKCAILAAYYSSYNPPSADRRFIFKVKFYFKSLFFF